MKTTQLSSSTIAAALIASAAFSATAAAQDSYDYRAVNLPGTEASQAFGINDRGQIAGTAFVEEGNIPFTYGIKKEAFELVGDVAGFESTLILALSNSGDLVGRVIDENDVSSGLLLDKKGNAHVFDHPDAVIETSARAINSRGQVVGIRDSSDPLEFLAAYIYDPKAGSFTDIVPSLLTIAQGINARGEVVGSSFFPSENDPCNPGAPPGDFVSYSWVRSAEGDVQFFTVNGGSSRARGITDSGTIVGFTTDLTGGTTYGFAIEKPEGQCQDILAGPDAVIVFPGASATFVASVNNAGVVVGQYNDAEGDPQTFVATPK